MFVAASAATGAAALRTALRIFFGAGPVPRSRPDEDETTGEGEEPEIRSPQRALPRTMTIVPASLIGLAVLVGSLPAIAAALARGAAVFTDPMATPPSSSPTPTRRPDPCRPRTGP
ncbi:hypothetical protein [Kitasatospora sp. NPDC054795]